MRVSYFFAIVFVICAFSFAAAAQCADAAKLEALDRAWGKYSDEGNRAELEKIYADDFANISLLEITGKKDAIDNAVENAGSGSVEPRYDNYMISCTPNTATITHRFVTTSSANGKEVTNYGRAIHFLEKRDGRWQVVSSTGHAMNDDALMVLNKEMDGYQAYVRRDIEWFEKNTADNYVGVDMTGNTHNKSQMLDQIRNNKVKYESVKLSDVSIRNEGDMAVITGIYKVKGTMEDGSPMKAKLRFTRTLAKMDGVWKAVASQAVAIDN